MRHRPTRLLTLPVALLLFFSLAMHAGAASLVEHGLLLALQLGTATPQQLCTIVQGEFTPATNTRPATCLVTRTVVTGQFPAGASQEVFTRTTTTTYTLTFTPIPDSFGHTLTAEEAIRTACLNPGGQALPSAQAARFCPPTP